MHLSNIQIKEKLTDFFLSFDDWKKLIAWLDLSWITLTMSPVQIERNALKENYRYNYVKV